MAGRLTGTEVATHPHGHRGTPGGCKLQADGVSLTPYRKAFHRMCPLFVQSVVVRILGGAETIVTKVSLEVLHVTIRCIKGCGGVT